MYRYDDYDRALVRERVAQFRDQVARRLSGELSEEEFLPLRLQNGLYLQKHAYMLRVAIPYGTLSSDQLRTLALIAREYDRGYGHFTTRQNIQFNWIDLERVPDILERLADVDMHAIQTSGNCVRNITTEAFAGVAADEVLDPRPLAEILRQWSTVNPEFLFLPRKFKIALCAAEEDRAAVQMHDIGLYLYRDGDGEMRLKVLVGGGLGRTPILAQVIREGLHWRHLLSYVEAVLRVYNRHGRRDNKYKARIKILVKDLTPEVYAQQVDEQWQLIKGGPDTITQEFVDTIAARFIWPQYDPAAAHDTDNTAALAAADKRFARWVRTNVHAHKTPGYAAVTVSLKATGVPPGDITADQMDAVAALADEYGFGELRVSHEQNLILADVRRARLHELWSKLEALNLATPNVGLLTNIIACPGGDFCALANAVSIPVAEAIQRQFDNLDYLFEIGELDLNISGCINSCGHHHVGHIGILGVDKAGEEWYQVTIGGRQNGAAKPLPDIESTKGGGAAIGRIIGPSFARDQVPGVVDRLIRTYLGLRDSEEERFIDVVDRVGIDPFKQDVYADPAFAKPQAQEAAHV